MVGDEDYRRNVALDGHTGELRVTFDVKRPCLRVELPPALVPRISTIAARLRRLFDLDAHPHAIDSLLAEDPMLAPLVERRPGLRTPGCWDRFEALIRTVLGQQVSLASARTLSTRVVEQFGPELSSRPSGPELSSRPSGPEFPTPSRLAAASIDALAAIGIPRSRATVLRSVAQAWTIATSDPELADPDWVLEQLATMPGVGPWTRDYAALRVLHLPDAFPASDGALKRVFPDMSPAAIERRSAAWRPFRAYAAQHLWTALALKEIP
jgi:AraC family transcriptional regulator of adaptative response / DNA-3-methyladenine glycosylase II